MKIKMIDLLIKIANKEAPKKIEYGNEIWTFDKDEQDYTDEKQYLFADYMIDFVYKPKFLNDEVEIIEDKKEIKPITMCMTGIMGFDGVENITTTLKDKINELVDEVNKLKKEKN